jgi:phosphate starvation-inducible PhoH-like protein
MPDATPLHMTFDDNALLPLLFGGHDENLARIEQTLGVALASRGNQVAISGPDLESETARQILAGLYDRLKRGLEVEGADVDAAIRLAVGGGPAVANDGDIFIKTQNRRVEPRSVMQARYIQALLEDELVFALGPAGTGKTYLAVAMAVSMLIDGRVDRIILTRPAVEAGEHLGFLPGDIRDKVDPYLRPLYDALHDMMPGDKVRRRFESGDIEIAPLAFMRGRTLSNAYVILDEGQNTSPVQMKMFLTRLGQHSRMVVTGDPTQIDLPAGARSGLRDAIDTLEGMKGLAVVNFTDADVVRHGLVTRIVRAYEARDSKAGKDRTPDGEPPR